MKILEKDICSNILFNIIIFRHNLVSLKKKKKNLFDYVIYFISEHFFFIYKIRYSFVKSN